MDTHMEFLTDEERELIDNFRYLPSCVRTRLAEHLRRIVQDDRKVAKKQLAASAAQ